MVRLLSLSLAVMAIGISTTRICEAEDAKKLKQGEGAASPRADYFPLKVGNQWHYRLAVADNSVDVVSTIARIDMSGKLPLARLETVVDGNVAGTEDLRVTDQGVFRHRSGGVEISPPICILKYPVKSGEKWGGEISVGDVGGVYAGEAREENVEVAAGKFKAMKVTLRLDTAEQTVITSYWFVKDVGFVKQTVEAGEVNLAIELRKFVPAKSASK